jgi:hypothetical protein
MAMAARMDSYAARDPEPRLRAEWTSMALHWRGLAHQAEWQDGYKAWSL